MPTFNKFRIFSASFDKVSGPMVVVDTVVDIDVVVSFDVVMFADIVVVNVVSSEVVVVVVLGKKTKVRYVK